MTRRGCRHADVEWQEEAFTINQTRHACTMNERRRHKQYGRGCLDFPLGFAR